MSTPIPEDVHADIAEDSLVTFPVAWPEYRDPSGDTWYLTDYSHAGDRVMYSCGLDAPMLRRDAESLYGPLTATGGTR